MTDAADARTTPRPHALLVYFGLLAPPLLWYVQENVSFGLASHACYPEAAPLAVLPPAFANLRSPLLALNLAMLVVCLAAAGASWAAWRALRGHVEARADAHPDLIDTGENRLRVFAASGLLVALLFAIAIGVNTISIATLSTCSQA